MPPVKPGAPSVASIEELAQLLDEAESSGDPIEMNALEWQRLRDDLERDALIRRKAS